MSSVVTHAIANNDRTVTGRTFGIGNGSRTVYNLAGLDSDRALLHPSLYKHDWAGITPLYGVARTNLALQSQTLNTTWTKSNVTISSDAIVAPDGTTTADKIVEAATTSVHYISQAVASGSYINSFYAKAGERNIVRMEGDAGSCFFDIATGTAGTPSGGLTVSITDVGNGWYRITGKTAAANTTLYISVCTGTVSSPTSSYLGDITKGLYVWGAQIETGSLATPYIPTVAAAVTVTDYSTAATGVVTFATAPASGVPISYKEPHPPSTNVYRHIGVGDGTSTTFSLPWAYRDPFVLSNGTLLGNGTATNLCLDSQTLQTRWTVSAAADMNAVAANQYTAPDGTVTADQIQPKNTTSTHYIVQNSVVFPVGVCTVSAHFKYDNHRWIVLGNYDGVTQRFASFDLLNGATGAKSAATTSTITSLGDGWYRVSMTVTTTGSGPIYIVVNNTDSASVQSWAAAGTEKVGVWGVQAEAAAQASTYIPTTTAAKSGDYTVTPAGVVTFGVAPAANAVLTWTGLMGATR